MNRFLPLIFILAFTGQIYSSCLNGETLVTDSDYQPEHIDAIPPKTNVFKNSHKTKSWYLGFWSVLTASEHWTTESASNSDVDLGLSPLNFKVGENFYGLYTHGPFTGLQSSQDTMALNVTLADFTEKPNLSLKDVKTYGEFGQINLKFGGKGRFYYELTCGNDKSGSYFKLVMHCQDAETLETEDRCVNSAAMRIPFTCDSVDWFMFGKVVKNIDAIPDKEDPSSHVTATVVNSYPNSYVDNAILLSGDVSLDQVEDNYKRELREIGAPSMIALFNFDQQPYMHSTNLINNSPVKAYGDLKLSPHCNAADGVVSSGIEQLDTQNPNYMQFEGYKTRYALDLRNTLTSLSSGHDLHVTREAVMFFGWAEVYKDFKFLKNKFYNGTKVFDYFTLAAANSSDHACSDYASMNKIVQLRHVVEVRDNQVVNSKVELVFFGKSVFPRRDQYIMRDEIAEGSYSYVLRLSINKESKRATFNFKDGFGKEVQYDTTRDEFNMMENPVAFIGNTSAELSQQSDDSKSSKNSEGINYTFFNYRYRTFGVSRGVTNHDLCKGDSDFSDAETDMALNTPSGARRLQAAEVFNPETSQESEHQDKSVQGASPALNHLFCTKSQKPFLTHKNTIACAVPDYTEDALC